MKRLISRLLVLSLITFLLSLASSSPASARETIGDCNTAEERTDCVANGGKCNGNVCVVTYTSSTAPYKKLQDEIDQGQVAKVWSMGRYWGAGLGTNGDTDSEGIILTTVNSLNLALMGPSTNGTAMINPDKSILGMAAKANAYLLTNPPASSTEYFADLGSRLSITKTAYAAPALGVGFPGLTNLLPLWKASRNIAYLAFIIAFLYYGLAIMFRLKISPQAVVSIQTAIPKLVVGLILVTFSYAIAGLIIDFSYVILYVGVATLAPLAKLPMPQSYFDYTNFGFSNAIGSLFESIKNGLGSVFSIPTTGGVVVGAIIGLVSLFTAVGPLLIIAAAIAAIPTLIIGIAVLWMIVKLFMTLLKCYISIILAIITGPIEIAIGTFSGQNSFQKWFMGLVANVIVFPIVTLAIILCKVLADAKQAPTWSPPGMSFTAGIMPGIIAIGFLFFIPSLPEAIKNALKVKEGYGSAIGQNVKGATGTARGVAGGALEQGASTIGGGKSIIGGALKGLAKVIGA